MENYDDLLRQLKYHPNPKAEEQQLREQARRVLQKGRDGKNHTKPVTTWAGNLAKLYLYLTWGCPFHCYFCFAEAGEKHGPEMNADELASVCRQASDAGYRSVVITGGEPLVYSQFDAFLENLRKTDRKSTEYILRSTLGLPLPEEKIRMICEVFDEVVVSLDGDEENHDSIRGKGVYRNAVRNIDAILRNGGCRIGINAVLEREKINGIPGNAIKEFCEERKIDHLVIQSPLPLGRAKCPEVQTEEAYEWRKGENGLGFSGQMRTSCLLGRNLYVQPDGTVFPCYAWCEEWHKQGNLRTETLLQILEKGELLKLMNTGVDTNRKCMHCDVRYFCGGKCKIYVQNKTDVNSGDFDCERKKQMIIERLGTLYSETL